MFSVEEFIVLVLRVTMSSTLDQRASVFQVSVDRFNSSGNPIFLQQDRHEYDVQCYDNHVTYRSDLLTNQSRSLNELLVGRSLVQCVCEAVHSQLAHRSTDPKRFNTIGPEELVTEEGLDDRRDTGYNGLSIDDTKVN